MNNKDEPKVYSSHKRVQTLNRIFEAAVEKANKMEIDEPKLYWTPIPEPYVDDNDTSGIWIPAGVSLPIQKALMLETTTKLKEMTSSRVQSLMQVKIKRLLHEAQAEGHPLAELLEQLPEVSEMMLLELGESEQGLVNLSYQLAEIDVIAMLINQVDFDHKATLNPQASQMLQDQDLQAWVEDVLTALEEI